MTFAIIIEPTALKMLGAIPDRRIQQTIQDRIDRLAQEPEIQGKPLRDDLKGYRSIRAVGGRYRIIYKVIRNRVLVLVVAVGIRREGDRSDIYRLAQRLIRLGLVK